MHFTFIPYGGRKEIELLYRDMEAQKFQLKLTKEGEEDKALFIPGQVRSVAFGVMEYVFPREYADMVLNTLCGNLGRYNIPKAFQLVLRKALKLKSIPKYEKKQKMLWTTENVFIMPIGIREDVDLFECKDMGWKDWKHEAL